MGGRGAKVRLVAVFSALAWARAASAQTPPPATAGAPAPGAPEAALVPPSLRSRTDAVYPPEALRDRVEGTVGIELVVDAEGNVAGARVTAPAGHGLDEAALAAARQFTFVPARRNGAPIRSTVEFAYEFHLPAPLPLQPAPSVPPSPPAPAPAPAPAGPVAVQSGPGQSTLVVARAPVDPAAGRNAASDSSTSQAELSLRPRFRAEGLLDVVPGLFSVQHAGGGKAQQDFARGFNLDHGTDLAFFVDDVPINAVSHAHGQGYSDLHFLIPETVARVDSTKGTYAADVGDFGTAGSVTFRMADHADESVAKVELAPSTGHERIVVVESPDLGADWRAVVAAEVFHENGPFVHPEDFGRLNAYAKATRVVEHGELSLMAMAYGGSWSMSGVLPARAVCGEGDGTPTPARYSGSSCINRWDAVDPTQGGASQRVMAWAQYRGQAGPTWELRANVYALHSNLQLFPNDGIAAPFQPDGVRYGSQIEQDDTRTESGANVRLTHLATVAGIATRTTLGVQIRNDDIDAQLHRTQARVRLDGIDANIPGPIYDGHTNETETGVYLEEALRPARWVRFVLGARGDRVDAATSNESATAVDRVSGYAGQGTFSPKASAIVTPVAPLDPLRQLRTRVPDSNDVRTLSAGPATTLVAPATGYEVGATVRPVRGLVVSAVGVPDRSRLRAHDRRRHGIDDAVGSNTPVRLRGHGRYAFDDRFYADVSFTAAHSRFTDAADVAAGTVYLPDAPIRTFSAAAGFRQPLGRATLVGSITVRSMSRRYGDPGPVPLVETGWTVVSAEAGVRWSRFEVVADLLNVADVAWREGQFEVASRLPNEGPSPPPGISFTPGLPRTGMVHGAVYW